MQANACQCSLLLSIAFYCMLLQLTVHYCSVLHVTVVCCSLLQCTEYYCSSLPRTRSLDIIIGIHDVHTHWHAPPEFFRNLGLGNSIACISWGVFGAKDQGPTIYIILNHKDKAHSIYNNSMVWILRSKPLGCWSTFVQLASSGVMDYFRL